MDAHDHDIETAASIAEAAAADADAARETSEAARRGETASAIGAAVSGAGAALAPLLEAVGVDDEAAGGLARAAAEAGEAFGRADEAAEAYGSATTDASRAGHALSAGGAIAGGTLGVLEAIAEAGGASPAVRAGLGIARSIAEAIPAIEQTVRGITEAIEAGERARHTVSYTIGFRDCGDEWTVREIEILEGLNRPYRARVVISSEQLEARPAALLGRNAMLTIRRGDRVRRVHGIVGRVEHGDAEAEAVFCTVEIVPALAALAHCRDHRIFQDQTVPALLETILGEHLAAYDRELEVATSRKRDAREIVVQYGETALDFVHRLMEEEGLSYFFEHHGAGPEKLVIVDENEHFPVAEVEGPHVPFAPVVGSDPDGPEPVTDFRAAERLGTTDVVVADYDWTRVSRAVLAEDRSEPSAEPVIRESYEALDAVHYAEYSKDQRQYASDDVAIQAALRAEAHRLERRSFQGRALAIGLSAGRTFQLLGHPVSEFDDEYLIVAITHRGRNPRFAERGASGSASPEYESSFTCVPAAVPHRPARMTPRPRIHGVQSAIVVGPPGEEIWCDEHGRIRIQFPWDRTDRDPVKRTCWVRCMQSWAGGGWGTFFVPRIGMEVVVTFVNGDPDRPLVSGCVYNGGYAPPYELPEHKTRSTIKTQSSPSEGNGYNELRFEDKRGSEEIFVHAQKDFCEVVEHDHATRVKNCQRNEVDVDHTEVVGRDQRLTVRRDRWKQIDENEDIVIGSNRRAEIGVDETTLIGGRERHRVELERTLEVGGPETEIFHGGRHCTVERHDVLHVKGGANRTVHVEGQYNIQGDERVRASQGQALVLLKDERIYAASPQRVTLNAGASAGGGAAPAHFRMEEDGTVVIVANTRIVLQVGDSRLVIDANDVRVEAPREVALATSASSFVRVGTSLAEVRSTNVDVVADQIAYVHGMLVKLN